MLPLSKGAALEHIIGMKWYRVRLLRTGDVARVLYERDVQANTYYDAVALIEQRCLVDHPGEVFEFDGVDRVWTPRPPLEVEGAPTA